MMCAQYGARGPLPSLSKCLISTLVLLPRRDQFRSSHRLQHHLSAAPSSFSYLCYSSPPEEDASSRICSSSSACSCANDCVHRASFNGLATRRRSECNGLPVQWRAHRALFHVSSTSICPYAVQPRKRHLCRLPVQYTADLPYQPAQRFLVVDACLAHLLHVFPLHIVLEIGEQSFALP